MTTGTLPTDRWSVVIAATFTADPLRLPLSAWCGWLGWSSKVEFAPFNQVFQQLLDPHSLVAHNAAGMNVFLIRVQDWWLADQPLAAAQRADEFMQAVRQFSAKQSGQLFVIFCPNSKSDSALPSQAFLELLAAVESDLYQRLSELSGVTAISSVTVTEQYPVAVIDDPLGLRAGHIPYSQDYFTALATWLVRSQSALRQRPAKVIVLDCDHTLWDGVCGEVGLDNVIVTPAQRAFQQSLLRLRDAGLLLCLCSKNNAADVWQVFDQHPDMLLRRQHITAARINWSAKSQNLRQLAQQLNLGIDSFVFIDDSPIECAEVRAHVPQVLTLQLPDSDRLGNFLDHVWPLDRGSLTDEDRYRAERYANEAQRDEARSAAMTLEQFLSELNLQVNFQPLSEEHIERAAQLTQRTNQFNLSTRRRTAGELRQWLIEPNHCGWIVHVADKFGDYGQVGLVLYEALADELRVDTLLLSCRALGRQIELHMLEQLQCDAFERQVGQIEILWKDSMQNQPARDFLVRLLGPLPTTLDSTPSPASYRVTRAQLSAATAHARLHQHDETPTSAPVADVLTSATGSRDVSGVSTANAPAPPWEQTALIACELNSIERITDKIRSQAAPRPPIEEAYSAPRTATEQQVVAICQDVLHLLGIGTGDSLKQLGASSLHMVQIYSRLEQAFSAGLSITDLFALPTIAAIVNQLNARLNNATPPRVETGQQVASTVHSVAPHQRSQQSSAAIAIVGMSGRFPGAANVHEFWQNVTAGVCSIVDIPDEKLNLPPDSPLRNNPNLVRKGASVQDVDKFDAKFFGIFPKEAAVMDPQHRLFLESCWHAIEDAGYNVERLAGPVGVFAGCYMDTYMLASLALSPKWLESLANAFHGGDLLTELGNDKDYLATRVSFLLNLRGPAMTVQTACSTSLVAIAQACQSLVSKQCDMALAGGSTLKLPQNRGYLYTEGGMVSPDGVCRTFDARARGTVFGEGCGVVLLKRVEDAVADGDDIYAVIKGWGLNNDGHAKLGYTAPSVEGQSGAIAMAHRAAGITADTITLMEAHGTGTSLGDPIEIDSLTRVFRQTTDNKQYCAIGSVKTNIGHLDVAAGVTGLIKTSLALRHRVLPPSLNFEQPNPNIDFAASPFYVNTRLRSWDAPFPRRAGLSSFGVGGTNAHVVVEEAPVPLPTTANTAPQLIVLSARTPAALDRQRLELCEFLRKSPSLELADVAYTLQTGRKTFNYTLAAVANTISQAAETLQQNAPQQVFQQRQVRRGKAVVFMFPGQGAQHVGMARDLYEHDSIFRQHVDHCAELLASHLGYDIRLKIFPSQSFAHSQHDIVESAESNGADAPAEQLNQTSLAQAGIFTVSYALAKRLEVDGIVPEQLIGHSVGEFVAACLAGVFSLADALRLIAFRATAMQQLPPGSMLAVRLTEAELSERLNGELSIAAINGPQLCVVSGPTAAVEELHQKLQAEEIVCRSLHTSHAFHSAMMDPVVAPFAQLLRSVQLAPPQIPIISTVTGQLLSESQATDPDYWAHHLRETVRFTDAAATVLANPDSVLLEVGPGQTLSTLARQHPVRDSEQAVLSTLPHAKQQVSPREHLLLAVGRLWQAGVDVDWNGHFRLQQRRRLHLPVYPFESQRYWLELEADQVDEGSDEAALETNGAPTAVEVTSPPPVQPAHTAAPAGQAAPAQPIPSAIDELTQRVIQQQLKLMKQQLEAWHSS